MSVAMIFQFHPQRSNRTLALEKDGETLIINGERFDFSGLEEGAVLPQSAIKSPFFAGPVRRKDNRLYFDILFPHGEFSERWMRYPRGRGTRDDGPISIPKDDPYQ